MTDNNSEAFGSIPNASANFGTVPQSAEGFGTIRNSAERTEHHTLTVRDVARMFEQANVPRTERSIINWCQPNRQGIARLDAFFDMNERKYFITPESVTRAVQEEQAKAANNAPVTPSPTQEKIPNPSETASRSDTGGSERADELIRQNRDLEIATRAKDFYIERLEKERDSFNDERQRYVGQLMSFSKKVGELETQLLQLGASSRLDELPHESGIIENVVAQRK